MSRRYRHIFENAAARMKASTGWVRGLIRAPKQYLREIKSAPARAAGDQFSLTYTDRSQVAALTPVAPHGRLWEYVHAHEVGAGIFKWDHYLDIYERHFHRLVGQQATVLEIGIYSGGSLGMWLDYFGTDCHVHGVDIVEDCRTYESGHVTVHIGDQADRSFWQEFRSKVPSIDVIIDDGGHSAVQQQTTMEEMLPYLSPGGVYVCEDIHGRNNRFAEFAVGLIRGLNEIQPVPGELLESRVSEFQ